MEFFQEHPLLTGLGIGLILALLTWFSARVQQFKLRRELKDLKKHLNLQMSLTSEGAEEQKKELEALKEQNENLRINVASLQQKPGRAEIRMLHVYEKAINQMQKQAPGFAPVWQEVLQAAEEDMARNEGGFGKLLKKVFGPSQITESSESGAAAPSTPSPADSQVDPASKTG